MLSPSLRQHFARLSRVAEAALGAVVSVPACLSCDTRIPAYTAFCPGCAASVEGLSAGRVDGIIAVGRYGGALGDAVRRLKYGDAPWVAGPLGDLLAARCLADGCAPDVVVPVPLHENRLRDRGYNQSALLATRLARHGFRVDACALKRSRDTAPQATLRRDARLENLVGAFLPRRDLAGLTVLLVDDVATTGGTLAACREAVKSAGGVVSGAAVIALVDQGDEDGPLA